MDYFVYESNKPAPCAEDFNSAWSDNSDVVEIDLHPIAEADVLLAHGRYRQAEEIMTEAIKDNPTNDKYKLKLLEILLANNNVKSFEKYLKALIEERNDTNSDFWFNVVVIAKDIIPKSPSLEVADSRAKYTVSH